MGRTIIECLHCHKVKEQHAKGLCYSCYRKTYIQKKITCSNCGRYVERHTKELCAGCYNTLNFREQTKNNNLSKKYKVSINDIVKMRSSGCVICGWKEKIHIHHIDQNKENNQLTNLIVLCPNHHFSLHSKDYQDKTLKLLGAVGIIIPKVILQIKTK